MDTSRKSRDTEIDKYTLEYIQKLYPDTRKEYI